MAVLKLWISITIMICWASTKINLKYQLCEWKREMNVKCDQGHTDAKNKLFNWFCKTSSSHLKNPMKNQEKAWLQFKIEIKVYDRAKKRTFTF